MMSLLALNCTGDDTKAILGVTNFKFLSCCSFHLTPIFIEYYVYGINFNLFKELLEWV